MRDDQTELTLVFKDDCTIAPTHGQQLKVRLRMSNDGIEIFPEGYGEHDMEDGHGSPVFIEFYDGQLQLHVWADINQEDPTHMISLEGARESRRVESIDITTECSLCHAPVPVKHAHLHQGAWIGDECCWDERLRSNE